MVCHECALAQEAKALALEVLEAKILAVVTQSLSALELELTQGAAQTVIAIEPLQEAEALEASILAAVAQSPSARKLTESSHDDESSSGSVMMSYEQKKKLSHEVNEMHPADLEKVAEIIEKHEPKLDGAENGEIPIDFAKLNNKTLQALYVFIQGQTGTGTYELALPRDILSAGASLYSIRG